MFCIAHLFFHFIGYPCVCGTTDSCSIQYSYSSGKILLNEDGLNQHYILTSFNKTQFLLSMFIYINMFIYIHVYNMYYNDLYRDANPSNSVVCRTGRITLIHRRGRMWNKSDCNNAHAESRA